MPCSLLNIINDCNTTCAGGVTGFYIISKNDIDLPLWTTNASGEYDSIVLTASATGFAKYEFLRETLNVNTPFTFNGCKGSYEHTVTGSLPCATKDNQAKLELLKQCLCCGVVLIVEFSNGDRFVWGDDSWGVQDVSGSIIQEGAIDGNSQIDITFKWKSIKGAIALADSVIIPTI